MYIMLNLNLKLGIGCSVTCNCACMPLRPFEVSEGSLFGSINNITYSVLSKKKNLSYVSNVFHEVNQYLPVTSIRKKDVQDQISSDILFMTITYPYALDR